ncbi:MAG TPA: hypothetical protein VLE44_01960 [Candidatus Saccharimonadales bacterium]|nr:hypothetical protein [Candidatus Saccharimonadales bacterium]
MDNQATNQFNVNLLRGWQRSQLKLLHKFTVNNLMPQTLLANASGSPVGSHELGGKLTALTRAGLIQKAGKDDNGQWLWQLNEDKAKKETLKEFLESIGVE